MNSEIAMSTIRKYHASGSSCGWPNGVSRPGTKFVTSCTAAISSTPTMASSRSSCRVGRALALQGVRAGQPGRERQAQRDGDEMLGVGHLPDEHDGEQHVRPDAEPQPQPPGRPDRRAGHAEHRQHAGGESDVGLGGPLRGPLPAGVPEDQEHQRGEQHGGDLVDDADDDGAFGAEHPFGEAGEEGERTGHVHVVEGGEREEVAPDQGQPAAVLEGRQPVRDVRIDRELFDAVPQRRADDRQHQGEHHVERGERQPFQQPQDRRHRLGVRVGGLRDGDSRGRPCRVRLRTARILINRTHIASRVRSCARCHRRQPAIGTRRSS